MREISLISSSASSSCMDSHQCHMVCMYMSDLEKGETRTCPFPGPGNVCSSDAFPKTISFQRFMSPVPRLILQHHDFFFWEIALILGFASAAFLISRIRDEIPLMLLTLENMRLCITRNPKNYSILRQGIFLQRIIKISHMNCIPKKKINNKKPSILQSFFFLFSNRYY